MSELEKATRASLAAMHDVLEAAYHRCYQECCGRPGMECCGQPLQAWSPDDQHIMDTLGPVEKALRAALAAEAERVSGWQSIATCPDSCRGEYPKFVLLWNGHHVGVGYCYLSEDGDNTTMYVDETDEIITPKPTHWQPLPKPLAWDRARALLDKEAK